MSEQAERDQHEAGERRQLEFDQRDEELDGENEERQQDDHPGEQQHHDLDEILKEADVAHEAGDRVEDWTPGIKADLRDPAWPQEIAGRQTGARGSETETGKAFEDDAGERIPVVDQVGKDTDEQGLLDKTGNDVFVAAPRPEQRRERDIDDDERRRKERDLAAEQSEAGIDIAREGFEETVDDAGAAHAPHLSC